MSALKDALETLGLCDEALVALRREGSAIPEQISAIEAEMEASRAAMSAERERLDQAERRHRALEAELQDTEAKRDHFQGQSAQVKTNQEYTALLHEIELTTQRIDQIEEQILECLELVESLQVQVARSLELSQAKLADLDKRLGERRERLVEVHREREEREGERRRHLDGLDPAIRGHYERVCQARGNGVARIRRGVCGACNREVPFEIINRVRAGEFHACGACQRILLEEPP